MNGAGKRNRIRPMQYPLTFPHTHCPEEHKTILEKEGGKRSVRCAEPVIRGETAKGEGQGRGGGSRRKHSRTQGKGDVLGRGGGASEISGAKQEKVGEVL